MQNKHSRCSFTAVITAKLSMFLHAKGTKYNTFCRWKLFLTYEFLFPRANGKDSSSFWIIEPHCCGSRLIHRFPLLSQRAEFPLALVTLTLSPWCSCPRPLCVRLPQLIKGSPVSHARWNVRGRLADGSRCSSRKNEGCVYVRQLFKCVRARLFTATSQDTNHLTCLLLALLPHWGFTAATVNMCACTLFINVLGLVTIYHPFLPRQPSPSSGPLGLPLPSYVEHTCLNVCAMHELLLDFILFICSKYLLI